ncbi:MAG: hydroxymethylglutaryl-CoA reductase [Planctomycetota bacterium]
MPTDQGRIAKYFKRLLSGRPEEALAECLEPMDAALSPRLTTSTRIEPAAVDRRWSVVGRSEEGKRVLLDPQAVEHAERFSRNIENFIGTAKVPLGVAGPLRVQGLFARGDYYVPMATTEAALVASCTRGAQAMARGGGVRAAVVNEGVGRAPAFAFEDLATAGLFVGWLTQQMDAIRSAAEATTRYGKLMDLRVSLQGNHVYLLLEYEVGEAAGQNMVTIATEAACRWIVANSPYEPAYWFVECNMSGDKKATPQSFLGVRGKKVVAEATVSAKCVSAYFHTTPKRIVEYYRMSSIGGMMSGTLGVQGHYANALAAVFIACGQDAACVAEAAVGVTRLEESEDGGLYASITLPNMIVGAVGGGTGLPSAQACLELLGLPEESPANALAEVCAALVLAGELSIVGALAAGEFTEAHRSLARGEAGNGG